LQGVQGVPSEPAFLDLPIDDAVDVDGQDRRVLASCGYAVDDRPDARDAVRWGPALFRMLSDGLFIRRDINAVNLVIGSVGLNPLDLWAKVPEDAARLLLLPPCRSLCPAPTAHHPSVGWPRLDEINETWRKWS
jgi:hypothetical protein